MQIRLIIKSEISEALKLAWNTFMKYEAPEYSDEGIKTFKSFIEDKNEVEKLIIYGAFDGGKIVGILATKNDGKHISLFFVDGSRHKQGIGKCLFQEMLKNNSADRITVNSSPYAVDIYNHLGFTPVKEEQLTNGIRYTPMIFINELNN
ncbi:hypothetical protein SDC9_125224 [bioreactor metagenome]|uniref:N-acetyltransferase domain-containing protein n=1 Tax=bioreactor metagenome TaxID=1076179 RepID=A0A645CMP4_9ZZZZ